MKTYQVVGITLLIALGLLAAFYRLNGYIYEEKQGDGVVQAYRGTLTGKYVCLPHTDPAVQTKECAAGILTDYYALDLGLMSQFPPTLSPGNRFSAAGVITPIELLSTDQWRQYPVMGIFSVTDSLKVSN
jgi:hypothetical protein